MTTFGRIADVIRETEKENAIWEAEQQRIASEYARQGKQYDPKRDIIMDVDAAQEFAVAIVKLAAKNYEALLMRMLQKPGRFEMEQLKIAKQNGERFFKGHYFEVLMPNTDGRAFMRQIQENAVTKLREKAEERLRKAKKNMEKELQEQKKQSGNMGG